MKSTSQLNRKSARSALLGRVVVWCFAILALAQLISACEKHTSTEHVRNPGAGNQSGTTGSNDPDPYANAGNEGTNDERDGGSDATGGSSGAEPDASISGTSGNDGGASGPDADTDTPPPPPPEFTKLGLLEALADCSVENYGAFEDRARDLVKATADLSDTQDLEHLTAAQKAWRSAMASWQIIEPLRFGPAARSTEPGGQDLRDQIYIFPLANYCKIDQQIVDQSYANASFGTLLASTRGLSAIEYLLFHNDSSNACLPVVNINSQGTWAALGNGELAKRRAAYAEATAKNVLAQTTTLVKAWDAKGGNFYEDLTSAGPGNAVFPLPQNAFNAVTNGLFYIEQEVKDWKLGWPLGLVAECVNAPGTCPDAVESRYARVSTESLRQNLIGFRLAFEGCGEKYWGLGFDDWLNAVGAEDLSTRMLAALVNAQQAVDDLNPPLEEAITSDPAKVRVVHTAVKALTDLMKTELVTVLDLELPQSAEGDND